MTNVFDFPPGKRDIVDASFLNDSAELVRFDEIGRGPSPVDGALELSSTDYVAQFASRDWTNQELASIYRVRSLLESAGVPTLVDRGQSDEGDPWCVFCRSDGEVFIHLCRIDGCYLLDSPNLPKPLLGASFSHLIESFSKGTLPATPDGSVPKGRVVRLNRDGNVFLHPATMLAALIWSIYLQSEDLVLVQLDEAESEAGFDWIVAQGGPSLDEIDTGLARVTDEAMLNGHMDLADMRAVPAEAMGTPRDPVSKQLITSPLTGVAAGLSAIAIACGFMTEGWQEDERARSLAILDLGLGAGVAENEDTAEAEVDHLPSLASILEGLLQSSDERVADGSVATDQDDAPGAGLAGEPPFSGTLLSPLITIASEGGTGTLVPGDPDLSDEASRAEFQFAEIDSRSPASGATNADSSGPIESSHASFAELLSIDDIKSFVLNELRPIAFGHMVIEATFDIAAVAAEDSRVLDVALAAINVSEEPMSNGQSGAPTAVSSPGELAFASLASGVSVAFDDVPASQNSKKHAAMQVSYDSSEELTFAGAFGSGATDRSYAHRAATHDNADHGTRYVQTSRRDADDDMPVFDEHAREFFFYLRGKSDEVEVIASGDRIVVVDFAIGAEEAVFMKWELSHGGTISTLGSRSDYEAFDLIA